MHPLPDGPPPSRAFELRITPIRAYAAAVLLVGVATGVRWLLTPQFGDQVPFLTFFPVVFLAAVALGLGPTLLVVASCAAVADYLYIEPHRAFGLAHPVAAVGLLVFVAVGVGAALLGDRARRARGRAAELLAERARLTDAVDVERARLHAALEQIPAGVVLRDADGRLRYCNPEAERVLGTGTSWSRHHVDEAEVRARMRRPDGSAYEPHALPVTRARCTGELVRDEEALLERADGTTVTLSVSAAPVRDPDGAIAGVAVAFVDVSERRDAEAALRESRERLEFALEAGRMGAFEWLVPERRVHWSPTLERMHGYAAGEFAGTAEAYFDEIHPDDRERVGALIQEVFAGRREHHVEYRIVRPDGVVRWVEGRGRLLHDEAGRPARLVGVCTDIHDRKLAEEALRESELRHRALVAERDQAARAARFLGDASAALGSSLDYEATLRTVARLTVPALADWCAIDLAEPDGTLRRIAITHVDPAKESWAWELETRFPSRPEHGNGPYAVLQSGRPMLVPAITPEMYASSSHDPEYIRLVRQLGLVSYVGAPLTAHGQVFGVLSLLMSDSGRHYTETELGLAEELGKRAGVAVDNARRHHTAVERLNMLDAVLAASPVGQAFVDRELRYVRVNPALAALHGVPVDAHAGRSIRDVLPAWAEALEPLHRQVFETGRPVLDREITVPAPDGGRYELLVNCFPVRDATGAVRWVGATKADVTERRRAERALHASEARLRHIVESPLIGIGFYAADGRVTGTNQALRDLLGYTAAEIAAGVLRWDTNLTAPEFRDADRQAGLEVRATGVSRPYAKELMRKDGSRVPVLAGGTRLDDTGGTGAFFILDLTERRRVEEQAQAAQRLEAVGQLAGGIAHEINNALQGVLGFNAFVLRRLGTGHPARLDAEQVQRSGERAATIAQQLLAYSRRQVLQPVDFDLVRLVGDFAPMLRQALGPGRELALGLLPAEAVVHADAGQLEQVLLNLTLNARDAMPEGGRLAVRVATRTLTRTWLAQHGARSLAPGDFVLLTVADSGHGMDAATRARIFEPFFTTKAVGQGTGLGLSVVHGIVQQSGGHITVDSAPGQGTTVTILLPLAGRPLAPAAGADGGATVPGGRETILVVDDEAAIRSLVGTLLREAGYEPLEAADGVEALALVAARTARSARLPSLLLTDIVMPGMGGRALGEALRDRLPALPVIYMSGYTDDEAVRRGLVAAGVDFLAKPFTPDELLRCVRSVLDRGGGA